MDRRQSQDEVDIFKQSVHGGGIPQMLKNHLNELLIIYPEKCTAIFEPVKDATAEQATFYLHKYRELADQKDGLPVAISCKIDKRNYVLEAKSNSVNFVEYQLPKEIPTKTSGFIFYLQEFSSGHSYFRFESSLKKGFCLAWSTEDNEKKLILKLPKDYNDETTSFLLL